MIEVNKTYDLQPGLDQQAYFKYGKRVIRTMLQAPGLVEIRVYRSLLGLNQIRLTLVWQTLADWAKLDENLELQNLETKLLKFATCINIELWGPSTVVPRPLRPSKLSSEQNLSATKMDFKLTWD